MHTVLSRQAGCNCAYARAALCLHGNELRLLGSAFENLLCFCSRFFVHGSTEIAALLAELADASSLEYMFG